MKKEYRKSRYTRGIVNGVRLWLVLVVLISSSGPMLVSADDTWSDNFNDLDYVGWTVDNGTFSAANAYLECTEFAQNANFSLIRHESNVSRGTWSLDCYMPSEADDSIGLSLRTDADLDSHLFIQVSSDRVVLWLNMSSDVHDRLMWQSVAWYRSTFTNSWTHIVVTLDEDWEFNVFVNNVHRISYTNSTPMSWVMDSLYFRFFGHVLGQAIDNVVVSDTIDYESLPFNTTQPETTTTTSTPPPDGVDMTMMLLVGGGGVAIVAIVLVVWKIRGRS